MEPIRHIRSEIFGVSQSEFSIIAGVSQATVSRWENGELSPGLKELSRIREEAFRRGLEMDDGAFFGASVPSSPEAA